jgi:hypothetical protein
MPFANPKPELLTAGQAGEVLGVTARRVAQLVAEGHIAPALTTPAGRLFHTAEIEQLAAARGRDT